MGNSKGRGKVYWKISIRTVLVEIHSIGSNGNIGYQLMMNNMFQIYIHLPFQIYLIIIHQPNSKKLINYSNSQIKTNVICTKVKLITNQLLLQINTNKVYVRQNYKNINIMMIIHHRQLQWKVHILCYRDKKSIEGFIDYISWFKIKKYQTWVITFIKYIWLWI